MHHPLTYELRELAHSRNTSGDERTANALRAAADEIERLEKALNDCADILENNPYNDAAQIARDALDVMQDMRRG